METNKAFDNNKECVHSTIRPKLQWYKDTTEAIA